MPAKMFKNAWPEILMFFCSALLFTLTLNPSIFHGDTTEFISAIATGGVAHPPGYPLLLILGKMFSLVPWFSLPVRLNFLSAVCSAFTIAFCARSIRLLTNSRLGVIFGSGLLAISSSFWLYSEVLETFSLNALLISIFIWQCVVFIKKPSKNRALFLIFILAINASNHHTAALLLPILAGMLWVASKKLTLGWKFWAASAFISLSGFLPYAYILEAARHNPSLNWDNAVNLKNLLHLILRKDFGTFILAPGDLSFMPKTTPVELYFTDLFKQTFGLLPVLAIAGFSYLYRQKQKIIFSILAYSFISLGPAFALLSRLQITSIQQKATLERFYIASFVPLAILAGAGAAFIISLLPKRIKIISFALPLLLLPPAIYALPKTNQRGNSFYENYSKKILDGLPPDAIFITTGDISDNGSQYLQLVQKIRPDVIIITLPKTVAPWYKAQLEKRNPELQNLISEFPQETVRRLCDRYAAEGKLYIASLISKLDLEGAACENMPTGLFVALLPPEKNLNLEIYKEEQLSYFANIKNDLLKHRRPKDLRTERVTYEIAAAMDRVGNFLLLRGDKDGAASFYNKAIAVSPYWNSSLDSLAVLDIEKGAFAAAIEKEREAIRRNPESPKSYFNLGILLKETGHPDEAKKILLDFLSFRPDTRVPEYEMANRALRELKNSK